MIYECTISGFGGQGIMSMGKFIAILGMNKSYNVIWLPSYGPEMRGGTAYCTVIFSDEEIGSPVVSNPTCQIVMNRPSLDKFGPLVKKDGTLFINSSLIDVTSDRTDITQYQIKANDIAIQGNNNRSANIAMLGAFMAKTEILDIKDMKEMMAKKFKAPFAEQNVNILMEGYKAAQELE